MKASPFLPPLAITVLYLGGFVWWHSGYPHGDFWSFLRFGRLNEIGDLLAGIFAPVAFLWLIWGYFLQSRELRLQRQALELQRQELAESTAALQDQARLIGEQIRISKALQRPFVQIWVADQAGPVLRIGFGNAGARAFDVALVKSDPPETLKSIPELDHDATSDAVTRPPTDGTEFSLHYDDILGQRFRQRYRYAVRFHGEAELVPIELTDEEPAG